MPLIEHSTNYRHRLHPTATLLNQPLINRSEFIRLPHIALVEYYRIETVEEELGHYVELIGKLRGIISRQEQGPMEMVTDLGADCYTRVKVRWQSDGLVQVNASSSKC